jgi:hypothetical protein
VARLPFGQLEHAGEELDRRTHGWRIQQPALAHWQDYLPATQGKWARGGDEITILDAGSQRIYFTLRQVQQMRGRAFYELLPGGLYQSSSGWRRIARPMQTSAAPCIWYGLAMRQTTERRGAAAVVLSDDRWFTFLMPESSAGSFRGYGWSVAFVLLTGYLDKGDLIAHKGSAPDYQFNFGGHWRELSAILHPLVSLPFAGLCEFALRNREALRALGKAALQGSCVDSDEKHILIGDLPGANIEAGMLAYSGECLVL